jgi:hypothetical protein
LITQSEGKTADPAPSEDDEFSEATRFLAYHHDHIMLISFSDKALIKCHCWEFLILRYFISHFKRFCENLQSAEFWASLNNLTTF